MRLAELLPGANIPTELAEREVAAIVCDALAAWLVGRATTWHKPTHPNA